MTLEQKIRASKRKEFMTLLIEALVGKEVRAFGPDSNCLWGNCKEEQHYRISKVECHMYETLEEIELDDEFNRPYIDVNIYLKYHDPTQRKIMRKYHSKYHGFIYTDEKFLSDIQSLVHPAQINYTEQGAQGHEFVSMEVMLPEILLEPDTE